MTEQQHAKYALMNGELVPYQDARVHVESTAFKYGAGVFEGLRAYWNEANGELYGFRLREHFQRLVESMRICRMPSPLDADGYTADMVRLMRAVELREDVHMRATAYVDDLEGKLGAFEPVAISMVALPMRRYFGRDGLHVQVSSWTRISDAVMPPRVKAIANYHNSRLAIGQARADGYDSAIILTDAGKVSEGPGFALFMLRGGKLVTPPVTAGILESVTRDTLMVLAPELGLEVVEREIDRTELYVADELFFCGSAAEVTPIFSVDRIAVGSAQTGPQTQAMRDTYMATVRGERPDTRGWLTPVFAGAVAATPVSTAVAAT